MKKLIPIVAGEPNSINSEIIVKAWKKLKNKRNLFIIGNYSLLTKQIKKIGLKMPLEKINSIINFKNQRTLKVLNIPLKYNLTYQFFFQYL
jgi:4-hydroxy-L-threonine phosphate dehydrogenase PdxA